jgi:xanthine dehydrogenase iron-sulfur cluster and FAD-binding subunit A
LATHNQVAASSLVVERAYPLARACWEVGAPQIRNRGTVAGNLITASPANDTITPLWALGASVTLKSIRGERTLPFPEFFRGVRKTALAPDEMLVDISFPAMRSGEGGTFIKLGLRKTQAISVVNAAVVIEFDGDVVRAARITLGSVAPTIVRALDAENSIVGTVLSDQTIREAGELAVLAARPITDVRGSADYRADMVRVLTTRALEQLRDGSERAEWPEHPALLWGKSDGHFPTGIPAPLTHSVQGGEPILTTINGQACTVNGANDETLVYVLRESVGLTGTKEGCGEGECGACTVYMDDMAVMACLVPAPRAHGANFVTIEGLARGDTLHPVQQGFISENALQCGYCTPGFVMAGAKLLEEQPRPTHDQILQSLSGNLCRCTGYVNIVRAIERAAEMGQEK